VADTGPLPFVSVIIPVLNDAEALQVCLQRLEEQTYPGDRFEVIVVDNGSDESIEPIVEGFAHARASHEPQRSSYAARNKGISLAEGEILAFLDSDCVPAQDWMERGVSHLLDAPNCGFVAGEVPVFARDPDVPTAVELFESVRAFRIEQYVRVAHFGGAGNLFVPRAVFGRVGPFRADLQSGGDFEWGQRVYAHGYTEVYADDVVVQHPARRTLQQLYRKMVRVAGGGEDLKRLGLRRRRALLGVDLELFYGLLPPLRGTVEVWTDRRLRNVGEKMIVTSVLFFAAYVRALERWRIALGGKPRAWR
jgi:glycosyltransferase involved in cell wall biosynthesis